VTGAFSCALLAGCGGESPETIAAHKIADALPDVIGPAEKYDVHVQGDPMEIVKGHAKFVTIDGKNVQLAPGLVMNELHIDATDLALNTKTRKVEHAGSVEFVCQLGQIHLNQYIAQMKPSVPGLKVMIRWTDIEAVVPVSAADIHTTVTVDGVLQPSQWGPDKLDFVPSGADVGPVPVPHRLLNLAMDQLNPVVDLSTMKFPVDIDSAQAKDERIIVVGTTTLGSNE
jgi:hypothetical protein